MANKSLNTRQKPVFRAPRQTPPVQRGQQPAPSGKQAEKKPRRGAPTPLEIKPSAAYDSK